MSLVEIKVPDIGDFDSVPVIELFVKVGDSINVDDAICTLESDKATMDVPSSAAGVVREVLVNVGDKVGEGSGALMGSSQRLPRRRPRQRRPPRLLRPLPLPRWRPRSQRPPPRTAEAPMSSTTWSCSVPAPAATRRPSAPRTWVSRPRSSSATPASVACA